jgi:hypothetical protein
MKFTVKVNPTIDNTSRLKAGLKLLNTYTLLVGFPEAEATPRDDARITNAEIGYINDRGSPARNIPPRPFLEPGVLSVKKPIEEQMRKAAGAAVDARPQAVEQAFQAAGLIAQAGIRSYMTNAEFTPLSPMTLRKRRAAGFMGTRPLIVTGQLRNAVNYAVRKKH